MILTTDIGEGFVFVSKMIRKHMLSPQPVPGFHEASDYCWAHDGWLRTIERYQWGAVLFCSSPRDEHFTAVLRGKVYPEHGLVVEDGKLERIPVAWYRELLDHFRRFRMSGKVELPNCLGFWIECATCDGGRNLVTNEKEKPCTWKARCLLFQAYLIEQNKEPQAYIATEGPEKVLALIAALEREKEKKRKEPIMKPKKKRRHSRVPPEVRAKKRYEPMLKFFNGFISEVEEAVGHHEILHWCSRRTQAVLSGSVYFVIKTKQAVLYLRVPKGRAQRLCTVRFAPINGGLDIQLPHQRKPAELPKSLKWGRWRDPPMFSIVRTLKTPKAYQWGAGIVTSIALAKMKEFE